MIRFTDEARGEFGKVIADAGEECVGLRLRAQKVGHHTFRYQLHLVRQADVSDEDERLDMGSFTAYVDSDTREWMKDATIDFVTDGSGRGFDIDNPAAKVDWNDPIAKKVQAVLDEQVGPALAGHGGWCELVKVEGTKAHVQLGGGCQGCAGAHATLKNGIEAMILKDVPEIEEVVDETDHAAGAAAFM